MGVPDDHAEDERYEAEKQGQDGQDVLDRMRLPVRVQDVRTRAVPESAGHGDHLLAVTTSVRFHPTVFPAAAVRNPQVFRRVSRGRDGNSPSGYRVAGIVGKLTGLRTTRLLPAPARDRDTSCHGRTVAASVQRRLRTPMRHYEIMIILDSTLEERNVQPSLDPFLKVVTGDGGKVEKVDIWGKRRLAYQIEKKSEGIYAVVDLTAEPATVLEMDRQLNLNEGVLRTKVMRSEHHH